MTPFIALFFGFLCGLLFGFGVALLRPHHRGLAKRLIAKTPAEIKAAPSRRTMQAVERAFSPRAPAKKTGRPQGSTSLPPPSRLVDPTHDAPNYLSFGFRG